MQKTVLVVDDDKSVLSVIRNILIHEGFDVLTAHNLGLARDALEAADCLVLDINIGDDNGLAFIRELREKGESIPALIMSGLVSFQADDLAVKYTRRPVFLKPLNFNAFILAIRDSLSESLNDSLQESGTRH